MAATACLHPETFPTSTNPTNKNFFAICVNDPGVLVNDVKVPRLPLPEGSTTTAFPVERLRLKYVVALNDPAFLTARTHRENLRKQRKQQKEERRRQQTLRHHQASYASSNALSARGGSSNGVATPMSSRMPSKKRHELSAISELEDDEPLSALPELNPETAQSGVRVEALKRMLGGDAILDRFGKPMPKIAPWLVSQKERGYDAPADAAPIRLLLPTQ